MKKPGRFRKGKKAYNSGCTENRSGKWKVLAHKYACHLEKIRKRKERAGRLAMAAMAAAMGCVQLQRIRAMPKPRHTSMDYGKDNFTTIKAISMAQCVIDTAEAISNILKEIDHKPNV